MGGASGGDLNHTVLAALDTRGDGEGERRYKGGSEKRENSSRAQRGCGLACGFNQLHKECEKYQEFGSGVGTPWCSVSLSLWSMLMSLERDTGRAPPSFASCFLHGGAEDTDPLFNVLGYRRKFVELLGDWILSCGLKDKLVVLGREWER